MPLGLHSSLRLFLCLVSHSCRALLYNTVHLSSLFSMCSSTSIPLYHVDMDGRLLLKDVGVRGHGRDVQSLVPPLSPAVLFSASSSSSCSPALVPSMPTKTTCSSPPLCRIFHALTAVLVHACSPVCCHLPSTVAMPAMAGLPPA